MTQHTPGPRFVKEFDESQVVVLGPPNLEDHKRQELVGLFTGPNRMENALLDAAAPQLLEAATLGMAMLILEARSHRENGEQEKAKAVQDSIEFITAAIAAATGDSE